MLGQVNETEFDLRFSLFGIPVRVHPGFWIVAMIMRRGAFKHEQGLALIGIWVAVVFVSILVHEMGHALAIRYFGWDPHVVLHYFGGYAAYVPTWGQSPRRSIIISFAGPGAGVHPVWRDMRNRVLVCKPILASLTFCCGTHSFS